LTKVISERQPYLLQQFVIIPSVLTALNMQRKSHGLKDPQLVMSKNIWGTLRMAVSLMGRPDLYDICDRNDLDSLNREFNMES
jgi:peroxin-5